MKHWKKASEDDSSPTATKTMTKTIQSVTVPLPEGVTARLDGTTFSVKGSKGETTRLLYHPRFTMALANNAITVTCTEPKPARNDKMMINTFRAHIRNMIYGVQNGYTAKLKICSGHFPITVTVDKNTVLIKNFLGEKSPRKATIYPGVKAKIEGDIITLDGVDKDAVGQTAARIENSTRITNRDRRIFQDGCYITLKAGEEA